FPTFGSERTGAPVAAYCRLAGAPIRTHEPITEPDALIVGDPSLFGQVDVLGGMRPDGYLVINATVAPAAVADLAGTPARICLVPAGEIARRHVGRAVPGTALLGAFAAVTGQVTLPALAKAIRERFPARVAEGNIAAAQEAYDLARAALSRQATETGHAEQPRQEASRA
ncbi:MAG TPA: 2-oxoacid:acceptor oxidoreductase family protein, partial [Rugosimonospora sp.]|nr:2-oxoacid:acceptor oxidoreductase family protein [Rugosimonospora sp.]